MGVADDYYVVNKHQAVFFMFTRYEHTVSRIKKYYSPMQPH